MGEVVVSSEDVERKSEKSEAARNFFDKKKEASSSAVTGLLKWEKLLRRMALRVLLVEADDSTRQIIAALLRKCCYRVAAVSDGLKAWEMLKERPRSVDLILTEVELPAISGYALLSLIMEHEICKNIPVIMMSRQDSVNTVYRCMLRGAADYLVKPVRRNELRNLWQHVWRRRSWIEGGIARQEDESVGQKRVEATSENNPASNHSSGNKACVERNTEHVDKESDDQSSCTRPDLEAESAPVKYMQEFSGKSLPNELPEHEALIKFSQEEHMLDSNSEAAHMDTHMPNVHKDFEPKDQGKDGNFSAEASNSFMDFSKVAIDFMGTSNNHKTASINVRRSLDSLPELNLSLRKSHTSVVENQGTKDHPTLWHPKASAFTRYVANQMQPPCMLSSSITGQSKECQSNSEKKYPCIMTDYSSDTPSPTLTTQRSGISQGAGQSKQSEVGASCPLSSICPAPVPANGITLNSHHNSYSSGVVPVFSMQSNPSSVMTPRSVNPQESVFGMNPHYPSTFETINSGQFYDHRAPDANCAGSQPLCKPEKQLSFLQDMGLVSPANDWSKNSSLCNGSTTHFHNIGYGSTCASNSNADQATAIGTSADSKNEDGLLGQGGGSSRSMQREAALTKFRLKRKDRCFEKKVRYESRKKLAEQRPRVKGQFVRQVWNDSHSMETKCHYGNASSG